VREVARVLRCAIYTRKSTEEGVEQEFKSLVAEREACAAYVVSQRHEGWVAVPGVYDDGGFSGGNMERPGLKALLAEVAAGRVDIIVVYKVDRLTRSLSDFARIVDVLDKQQASFVSITQSFNTTTSMGRLTLNVLLSFAQFEREVTGERIRDKIAASKAKGMWMGGPVPLGYDLAERKLVINEAEAAIIRRIYERYLELRSGHLLMAELEFQGIRSKPRVNRHGRTYGNQPLSRGALYAILQSRLYVGEVTHKQHVYAGQHPPIVERGVFDAVQAMLANARVERSTRPNAREASLFAGLIFDGLGRRMSPSHANKAGKRYRYYVSRADGVQGQEQPTYRVSAGEIEQRVMRLLTRLLEEARDRAIASADLRGDAIEELGQSVSDACAQLAGVPDQRARELLRSILRQVRLFETELVIDADMGSIHPVLGSEGLVSATVPIGCVRTARQVKLVLPSAPTSEGTRKDPALIKLVVQAVSLRGAADNRPSTSFDQLSRALGYSREHAADLLRLGYLAPDIISAIIDGRQPAELTRTRLMQTPRLPLGWQQQRAVLGF
jgi:site-specific DNA recombinase